MIDRVRLRHGAGFQIKYKADAPTGQVGGGGKGLQVSGEVATGGGALVGRIYNCLKIYGARTEPRPFSCLEVRD